MSVSHVVACLLVSLLLAACGERNAGSSAGETTAAPTTLTAATLGEQVVLPTRDYLTLPRYADADRELGNRLAMHCRACHSLEAGGPNLTGPNLHGFFGRKAGSNGSYAYSPAFREADFVWTPEALDAWLAQPATFLPGNRMVYAGLPDAADRDAVIAVLLRQTTQEEDNAE